MAAVLSAVQPQYSDAPGRARAYGFDHAAAGDLRLDGRRGRASAAAEKGRPRVSPEQTSESHAPDQTATTRERPLDLKSVVAGKRGSVRLDHGGRTIIKKNTTDTTKK